MNQHAFLFPGQGAQYVGMGRDLYREFDYVRELFDMAEETTRINISRLCFKGPMEELTQTVNLQPAVTAVNLACLAAVVREGRRPEFTAGHSLGEFSALKASGAITAEDTLRLVYKRGELMHREATRNKGAMSAVIGLDIDQVEAAVRKAAGQGPVSVANHNTAEQIVITGAPGAVKAAAALAREHGARVVPLKVSGAWHSELIAGAVDDFRAFVEAIDFKVPEVPILFNVTGEKAPEAEAMRKLMVAQLCSPVRWHAIVQRLAASGAHTFVELGPGRVLTGLVKKILPAEDDRRLFNVFDLKSLETFLQASG